MRAFKLFFLVLSIVLLASTSLQAWTSSNEGVCYTMDTLTTLSPNINYNTSTGMYEVHDNIIILENDTLKILPGEIVKFIQSTYNWYGIEIYGCFIAKGNNEQQIVLGDPEYNISYGNIWRGIQFFNTSQNGESLLKYCTIRGALNNGFYGYESAIYCENSSPILDHCGICYMLSSEETGGGSGISCKGQSYPIISYCTFEYLYKSVAIWCSPWAIWQDTINYPSPLIFGCIIKKSVTGFWYYPLDYDVVVFRGGFLDNCYLGVPFSNFPDTTLGIPIDTIGDGICNTNSTNSTPRYMLVDGVVNPRGDTLFTNFNEHETEILPTTTEYLVLNNNFPNPFYNHTTIEFIIKEKAVVNLILVDSRGNRVKTLIKNQSFASGEHQIKWYADNDAGQKVPNGIYFYKLSSGNNLMVKKAILVK